MKPSLTNLSDGHGLQTSPKQRVELLRASADPEDVPPVDGVLEGSLEAGLLLLLGDVCGSLRSSESLLSRSCSCRLRGLLQGGQFLLIGSKLKR